MVILYNSELSLVYWSALDHEHLRTRGPEGGDFATRWWRVPTPKSLIWRLLVVWLVRLLLLGNMFTMLSVAMVLGGRNNCLCSVAWTACVKRNRRARILHCSEDLVVAQKLSGIVGPEWWQFQLSGVLFCCSSVNKTRWRSPIRCNTLSGADYPNVSIKTR